MINVQIHPKVQDLCQQDDRYLKTLFKSDPELFQSLFGRPARRIAARPNEVTLVWEFNGYAVYVSPDKVVYKTKYEGGPEKFVEDTDAGKACASFLATILEVLT